MPGFRQIERELYEAVARNLREAELLRQLKAEADETGLAVMCCPRTNECSSLICAHRRPHLDAGSRYCRVVIDGGCPPCKVLYQPVLPRFGRPRRLRLREVV